MAERKRVDWAALIVLAFLLAGLLAGIVSYIVYEQNARDDCRQTGGRVERVQGGSGGFICLR